MILLVKVIAILAIAVCFWVMEEKYAAPIAVIMLTIVLVGMDIADAITLVG